MEPMRLRCESILEVLENNDWVSRRDLMHELPTVTEYSMLLSLKKLLEEDRIIRKKMPTRTPRMYYYLYQIK